MSHGLTFNNLNYYISNCRGSISLKDDVVLDGRVESLNFRNGIEIKSDNIIIDGAGHTIDAKGKVPIFNISADNVVLKNINFKNGFSKKFGGAIRNAGSCRIINCTFENNSAKKKGDDISNGSEMHISNCRFSHEGSIWNPGSIYAPEDEIEGIKPYVLNGSLLIESVASLHGISFDVVDDENNPVNGAMLTVDEMSGLTDESGICSLDGVAEGIHKVRVCAEGYKRHMENIDVSPENTRFSFALTKIKLPGGFAHIQERPFQSYTGNEPYVFASYAHDDALVVFKELKRFHDLGLKIWYDEGITSGSGWQEEVESSILNSSLFIVFLSQNAVESENVRKEIFLAIDEKIPIIPIYLEETELKYGLRLEILSVQSILKYAISEENYLNRCRMDLARYGFVI